MQDLSFDLVMNTVMVTAMCTEVLTTAVMPMRSAQSAWATQQTVLEAQVVRNWQCHTHSEAVVF